MIKLMADYCTDGLAVWNDTELFTKKELSKMGVRQELINKIGWWVDIHNAQSDTKQWPQVVYWFTSVGENIAQELADDLGSDVAYFDEVHSYYVTIKPKKDVPAEKTDTEKTAVMWKSTSQGKIVAAEVTTIIAQEKFFIHANDWWSGEGFDVSIEGPKGEKHHISLPHEAWAVLSEVIGEMTGGTEQWIRSGDK